MKPDTFLLTFLEGTEEIIKSDKACTSILHWANKMSISENSSANIEVVAAFLQLSLQSEISAMVSYIRHYQADLYEGYGGISDEERELMDEKDELWDLEKVISELLLEIVKRANGSEKRYKTAVEQYKNTTYRGSSRLETIRKMRRYLDATILFLKSLDEINIPVEERGKYISLLLEMGKPAYDNPAVANKENNQTEAIDPFIVGILKQGEIIAFDSHIPRITDNGVKFLRLFIQEKVTDEFSELIPKYGDQLQVTDDETIKIFTGLKIIEADGHTISEIGLEFFHELARDAFKAGLPIGNVHINLKEKNIKSIEEIKEISDLAFKERIVETMLASARKFEGFDSIVLGWIVNKKF